MLRVILIDSNETSRRMFTRAIILLSLVIGSLANGTPGIPTTQQIRTRRLASCPTCPRDCPAALASPWYERPLQEGSFGRKYREPFEKGFPQRSKNDQFEEGTEISSYPYEQQGRRARSDGALSPTIPGSTWKYENPSNFRESRNIDSRLPTSPPEPAPKYLLNADHRSSIVNFPIDGSYERTRPRNTNYDDLINRRTKDQADENYGNYFNPRNQGTNNARIANNEPTMEDRSELRRDFLFDVGNNGDVGESGDQGRCESCGRPFYDSPDIKQRVNNMFGASDHGGLGQTGSCKSCGKDLHNVPEINEGHNQEATTGALYSGGFDNPEISRRTSRHDGIPEFYVKPYNFDPKVAQRDSGLARYATRDPESVEHETASNILQRSPILPYSNLNPRKDMLPNLKHGGPLSSSGETTCATCVSQPQYNNAETMERVSPLNQPIPTARSVDQEPSHQPQRRRDRSPFYYPQSMQEIVHKPEVKYNPYNLPRDLNVLKAIQAMERRLLALDKDRRRGKGFEYMGNGRLEIAEGEGGRRVPINGFNDENQDGRSDLTSIESSGNAKNKNDTLQTDNRGDATGTEKSIDEKLEIKGANGDGDLTEDTYSDLDVDLIEDIENPSVVPTEPTPMESVQETSTAR